MRVRFVFSVLLILLSAFFMYAFNIQVKDLDMSRIFKVEAHRQNETVHSISYDDLNLHGIAYLNQASCNAPLNLSVKNLKADEASIQWKDPINSSWEYYVQDVGMGLPIGGGIATSTSDVIFTSLNNGTALVGDTDYEIFVRSNCGNGVYSSWAGPLVFKTKCSTMNVYPFEETFNTTSTAYNCWTLFPTTGSKTWKRNDTSTYEGDRCMYFRPQAKADAWLISPSFTLLAGDTYELSFYYKTNTAKFEVLLSNNGVDISEFKTVLQSVATYKTNDYTQKKVYITGQSGTVNLAWHAFSDSNNSIYIDLVRLEKVNCINPLLEDIEISNIQKDKATFSWKDDVNVRWEYYLQLAGGVPPAVNGVITTSKNNTLATTSGANGSPLLPNTEYEFFLRSNCQAGKGKWEGPIKFRTPCAEFTPPFWEGFNTGSTSIDCWRSIDLSDEGTSWGINIESYEGDHSFYYRGSNSNNWLISPTFKLDKNKHYVLKYHYKTSSYYTTNFDVKLSTTGSEVKDFNTTLITKKGQNSSQWEEEISIITGIGGNVNFAFHVTAPNSYAVLNVDNIFLEEVACPQPINLNATNITKNSVSVEWNDQVGTKWEYLVQIEGGSKPISTTKGVSTTKKLNPVTKDIVGKNLESNTVYEFYVRADCGAGTSSIWSGPYVFRTLCDVQALPFWEGFNGVNKSLYCWTILDLNNDGSEGYGLWDQYNYDTYEGTHSMNLSVFDYDEKIQNDDWLISPTFQFLPGKMYRLKYHYKGSSYNDNNGFEVVASNSGLKPSSFTKEVLEYGNYENDNFIKKTVFISGISGDVNIAWHVNTVGSKDLMIDNVFVEEVLGCPEPIDLDVSNIKKNEATVEWTDDFGATGWEYYVVDSKGVPPTALTTGISTKVKKEVIAKDITGTNLLPNTTYMVYVRTVCGNGQYSIWSDPIQITTLCDIYPTPFWEGFNKDSKTTNCWTILDNNEDGTRWELTDEKVQEGNLSMLFLNDYDENDDWLISPTLEVDNGMYILKYHYSTYSDSENEFEVLMSTSGVDPSSFTSSILAKNIYKNDNYLEEVVFFNTNKGLINIGWHTTSTDESTQISLDNISLKKVETCPEPYYVTISNTTTVGFDVSWQQTGGVTSWEVLVVPYGAPASATPIQQVQVSTTPKVTLVGLPSAGTYSIYVRGKCDSTSNSDWSTAATAGTKVGLNDNCTNPIVIPVSSTDKCIDFVSGSLLGATISTTPSPGCNSIIEYDTWFEFTATSDVHLLNVSDLISLSGLNVFNIYGALYNVSCTNITANNTLECFQIEAESPFKVFNDLVVGQKYLIRIGGIEPEDISFKLCITSPEYLKVKETYTVEQLVKDILVVSPCNSVSNVTSQTGIDFGEANGIGYFENTNPDFAFKKGIILATNAVKYAPGPGGGEQGYDSTDWLGDADLQKILNANGQVDPNNNASILEFDFIPIVDSLRFNFIFASNEYGPSYQCNYSDVFAFLLTDLTTGEVTNLAVVPNTSIPISVTTIRDEQFQGQNNCGSSNKNYFDKFYGSLGLPIKDNPINFAGRTIPMVAKSFVKPGRKYHIKMAIADYRDAGVDSAVFLEAGSFDLGKVDLGKDLLVETGNALCASDVRVIKSGLSSDLAELEIQWYKDGTAIAGATKPDLTVTESGVYKVIGIYTALECSLNGEVKIEIFPPIHDIVGKHSNQNICRFALEGTTVDLTTDEKAMFSNVSRDSYELTYYTDKELANPIVDPSNYMLKPGNDIQVIFIHIQDKHTGCSEVFTFDLVPTKGDVPTAPSDVLVCDSYVLPAIPATQHYYSEAAGKGKEFKSGEVLKVGEYKMYLLQQNGLGCYEEVSFVIKVTEKRIAKVFEDQLLSCEMYTLKDELDEYSKYYIDQLGKRVEVVPGTVITQDNTKVYVVAKSKDGVCVDESSFTIRYAECPIPKGISPNGDGLNDRFDLSKHGVSSIKIFNRNGTEVYSFQGAYTNQWDGTATNKKELPSGTYFYVIQSFDKTRTGWLELNR